MATSAIATTTPVDGSPDEDSPSPVRGSICSGLAGEAVGGQLAGTALAQLPSFLAFWFAWSDFYVNTELYEAAAG